MAKKLVLEFRNSKSLGIFIRATLLVSTGLLSFFSIIYPQPIRPASFPIKVGDVASQDIQAPYALSYTSEILSEQVRNEAINKVQPVYLPADPSITRRQIERLRVALAYINSIRIDPFSTPDQKFNDLAALLDVRINREIAEKIFELNDVKWQLIQQESLSILEQIMRNSIREDQIREYKNNIPTLISYSIPQDQAQIISILVEPFLTANSLFSAELTELKLKEVRDSVDPVIRNFIPGEIIVRRGQIITPVTYEVLQEFNLIQPEDNIRELLATGIFISILTIFAGVYFNRRRPKVSSNLRSLSLIAITFLVFLVVARIVIPNRTVVPYIYPVPAFGLTIASVFSTEIGLILSIILSIIAPYNLSNSLDLTLFYTLSSLFGILILGKGLRIGNFFWSGLTIGFTGSAVILAYRLPNALNDLIGLATLIGASFINGFASASLTLLLQFLLSQLLGITTALQLLEFSRPDHPLQQFILQNAPGTYQHSLQVAILAEQAGEPVGADSLLIRVGAIYHDSGKALNPTFFIENQVPGNINPHDDLDPTISAQTIIKHVTDGVHLAQKYKLPPRIIDFIKEHHGTMLTRYQYARAIQIVGDSPEFVNADLFRYPGPKPQSKETALLMLADGVQARARAELPKNEDELRIIIKKVITHCQREGQLDDTGITLRDLTIISEAFIKTLKNTYHPRIQYPELSSILPSHDIELEKSTSISKLEK